ncbi:MAG: hypothetical protein R3C11_10420 [Planctomycetaceae bacterium]
MEEKIASLQAKSPKEETPTENEPSPPSGSFHFDVGMQVRHPRYGRGKIVHVSGTGAKATVTVDFANGEVGKTFRADRSPLQPIGMR